MNSMLLTATICAVVGPGLCVLGARLLDSWKWDILGIILCVVGGLMVVGAILFPAVTYGSRAYGRVECRNWGQQTGHPVRFTVLTSWDTGSCLTKDNSGRWVSKDQIRVFASGK